MVWQRRRFAIHITAISLATLAVVAFADRIVARLGADESLKKAFEMFFNFYSTGSFVTASSSDTLTNHYVWQGPWWVFFIGEPIRSHALGNFNLDTDVGYIQIIHNFGIFAAIVIVLLHLRMLAAGHRVPQRIFLLHVCMTVVILVTCFKGPYFFVRGPYDVWIVSFVLCSLYEKRHGIEPCLKPSPASSPGSLNQRTELPPKIQQNLFKLPGPPQLFGLRPRSWADSGR
jgi:hypothetical protein